jgi:hypothetical protein
MAVFTIKKHINAPREKVFAHASNFGGAPEAIKGIKKVEMLTNGPVGVGTRFKETRVLFKREATEVMEVTAFNAPDSYTLGCDSCGCRYRTTMRFLANGTGTDVEMDFGVEALTVFAKIMGIVMRPMLKACCKMMEKDLDELKASVETRGA